MERHSIEATTIEDSWYRCLNKVFDVGTIYKITRGSFETQYRLEIPFVDVRIKYPGSRLITQTPEASGVPPPNDLQTVETYFAEYVFADLRKPGEQYTYGQRLVNPFDANQINDALDQMRTITEMFGCFVDDEKKSKTPLHLKEVSRINQVNKVIEMYRKGFGTNQAAMEVGMPSDILLPDPPCLRLIDTRVWRYEKDKYRLDFFVYFRSWDLWGGYPTNLGGIELLKQHVASEIGVENGELLASSKGLHFYDHAWKDAFKVLKPQTWKEDWPEMAKKLMEKGFNDPDLVARIEQMAEK